MSHLIVTFWSSCLVSLIESLLIIFDQSCVQQVKAHWGPSKLARVRRRFAFWVVKNKRPMNIFRSDVELQEALNDATDGAIDLHNPTTIRRETLAMSAVGLQRVVDLNRSLKKEKLKVVIAGDIWGEGGVSLLGII